MANLNPTNPVRSINKSNVLARSLSLSMEEIKELKAAFILLDKNSDGRVSPSELESMLKTFGISVPEKHIVRIINRASSSSATKPTGPIGMTETEFIAWISSLLETDETNPEEDIIAAFQVFDLDGNGYITKDELKRAMEIIGETVDEAELDRLIALVDVDKDGRVDYAEFARVLI